MSATPVETQVNDSLVKGIAGSQKNANTTATTARNASKGRFKKSYKVVIFVILVLLLLNSWRQWYEKRLSKPEEAGFAQSQSNVVDSQATPDWVGKEQVLILSQDETSKPIRVTGDRCIRWWGDDPDGNVFLPEVRGVNDPTWYEWNTFLELKKQGNVPYEDFGWVRFKGNQANAKAMYAFQQKGQCT